MNKSARKLRLNAETLRQLNPDTLREVEGGAFTDLCTFACTRVTRCVDSCPCQQTDFATCLTC